MATVNYSVPDDVKQAFNRTFAGKNKSAIIAELMRQAVADAERRAHAAEAFRQLTEGRKERPAITDEQFRNIREESRT